MHEKIKTISKYVLNILTIINALLLGVSPIWVLNTDKITATITVVMSVISGYLLGHKAITKDYTQGKIQDYEVDE